ncbi:MAG: cyclic peptide export ABC transporter [Proteobacteria bacterium]|nr:cyclic peptide export ABC transporter [Pseudomonadota bacterium]
MRLVDLFRQTPLSARRRLLLYSAVSGLASAGALSLGMRAAQATAEDGKPALTLLLPYALAVGVYLQVGRVLQQSTNNLVQRAVHKMRVRLLDRLCHSGLREMEALGRGRLFTRLADGTSLVSMAGPPLGMFLQQSLTFAFALAYLCWLSVYAFGLVTSLLIVSGVLFAWRRSEFENLLERLAHARSRLVDSLGHILRGGREIRLDQRRNDALFAAFRALGAEIEEDALLRTQIANMPLVYSDFMLYVMVGAVVFLLPALSPQALPHLSDIESACLFMYGPMSFALLLLPVLQDTEAALRRLDELEGELSSEVDEAPDDVEESLEPVAPGRLSWRDLVYSYPGADRQPGFTCGPVDLDLARGELLFVVGGNGSGKSTLLKLVTGLYQADAGQLRVDGDAVDWRHMQRVRELYGAVFPDCFLFDRLYGVESPDAAAVNRLIEHFGLSGKVTYEDGGFSRLKLSTGQRKRLALIELLLEDRPIFVLDEWAADQDGDFRERFYTEILPDLKRRGKTILAVTHDDRWFHVADRVVKLDLGRVVDAPAVAS